MKTTSTMKIDATIALIAGTLIALLIPSISSAEPLNQAVLALESEANGADFFSSFEGIEPILNTLGDLNVTDAELELTSESGRSGIAVFNAELIGIDGSLIFLSDEDQEANFIAFLPSKTFKFENFIDASGNGSYKNAFEVFNSVKFEDALVVISGSDISLDLSGLDSEILDSLEIANFAKQDILAAPSGVSVLGTFDVEDSDFLALAFDAVGFEEAEVLGRTSVEWSVEQALEALIGGSSVLPALAMQIDLPSFKPTFFGQLKLGAKFDFSFNGSLAFDETAKAFVTSVSMGSIVDTPIGDDDLETSLVLSKTFSTGSGGVSTDTQILLGLGAEDGYENAFGWDFLTINNFAIDMTQTLAAGAPPKISNTVGMGGDVEIGSKQVIAYTSFELGPVITPNTISLEINDGPDKVGSIGMSDMVSLFEKMVGKALPEFPLMDFKGLEKGKGPSIYLSKDLIDVSGKMSVMGQDIVTIESGFFSSTQGVDIKGVAEKINLGPVEFPSGVFEAKLLLTPSGFVGPKVNIQAETDLFGGTAEAIFQLNTDGYSVSSGFSLGKAFGISYRYGVSGLPQGTKLNELDDIEASFSAEMSTDISGWINSAGKDRIKTVFKGLFDSITAARASTDSAQKSVDGLASEISNVANSIQGIRNQIQSCNQTFQQCFPNVSVSCKRKKWGICVEWKTKSSCSYRTMPDYPKRTICETNNGIKYGQIATKEIEKKSIQVAKTTADEILKVYKDALSPIKNAEETINNAINNLSAPNIFSIESATISGDLSSAASGAALDANIVYTVGGSKTKTAKIKFKLSDFAYTAEQLSGIVADAFVEYLDSQLKDPTVKFLVSQAKSTLNNIK